MLARPPQNSPRDYPRLARQVKPRGDLAGKLDNLPDLCAILAPMAPLSDLLGPLKVRFLLLTPACVAAGVGTAFWRTGRLDWGAALLALGGAVAAHAAVNALNEYSDFRSGIDARTRRTPFSGGSGTLQRRPELAGYTLRVGLALALVTALIGLHFALRFGPSLLPLGLAGLALVLLYTPWINRNAAVCLVAPGLGFGICMVMGTDLLLGGGYSWAGFFASLVPFFLVNNLLLLNQFPDLAADRWGGRRHLLIARGLRVGATVYALFNAGAFLSLVGGVLAGALPPLGLLGLTLLPLAALASRGAFRYEEGSPGFLSALALNVVVNLAAPSLLAVGCFLSRLTA